MPRCATGSAGGTTSNQKRRAIGSMLVLLLAATLLLPRYSAAASDNQWVALTLARDGAWGTATHVSRARSISLAIANCRQMARRPNDCGSLHTSAQAAWSLAMLCGDYNIVVTAHTLIDAEEAARHRQTELRALLAADLPACVRIVTVDPNGRSTVGEEIN